MTWKDTPELREKLEKNGIEWSGDYDDNGDTTSWKSPSGKYFSCCHDGFNHDLNLYISPVTPDQAIAATLGSDVKPCYATDYTHEHCKYSVNRGWVEDTRFFIPKTATLGNDTLTAEQVHKATYKHSIHADFADADWQAIADELNAVTGGGECEMEPIPFMGWKCSKCGKVSMVYGDKDREMPRFCPNCGKAVKR